MHITIAGKLGSGKSTISRILQATHGFTIYSTGAIQREIAKQKNISTLEMNRLMADDLSFDNLIDETVTRVSREKSDETIIFDSRMAWNFAENSFKVYVTVDPLTAASRVINDPRGKEEVYRDVEDAKTKLLERAKLENERFKEIYGVDNFNYLNYNLVIDSTFASQQVLADIIYDKYQEFCRTKKDTNNVLLSPKSLFPLKKIMHADTADHITVIPFDGYHYIIGGHLHALTAMENHVSFVSADVAETQNLVSLIKEAGISTVHEYENAAEFRYNSYPSYYTQ
jgi:cytidylate kinase